MTTIPPWLPAAMLAFENSVEKLGQAAVAKLAGRTQGAVSKRLRGRKPLWHDAVLPVEAATGIPRHALRPDLYPPEEYSSSPGTQPDGAPAGGRRKPPAGAGAPGAAGPAATDPLEGFRS